MSSAAPPPLDGLRVLDLTRVLAGPYCTMMLADLGAEVIKVEQPEAGDETRTWGPPFIAGEAAYYLAVNRSKRSVTLDLKAPADQDVALRLAARAVAGSQPGPLAGMAAWAAIAASQDCMGRLYCPGRGRHGLGNLHDVQ